MNKYFDGVNLLQCVYFSYIFHKVKGWCKCLLLYDELREVCSHRPTISLSLQTGSNVPHLVLFKCSQIKCFV